MPNPVSGLDDVVHQRVRLGIMAALHEVERAEFQGLRDLLAVTDGNLSRHLRVLEEAGLVQIQKGYDGRRPRTWVHSTSAGEAAFAQELTVLRDIVSQAEAAARDAERSVDPDGAFLPVPRLKPGPAS